MTWTWSHLSSCPPHDLGAKSGSLQKTQLHLFQWEVMHTKGADTPSVASVDLVFLTCSLNQSYAPFTERQEERAQAFSHMQLTQMPKKHLTVRYLN